MKKQSRASGFTITEIIISISIVAILVTIFVPSYSAIKRRAEKARCIGNLKVLHTGFDGYILEFNQWPQMPQESMEWEETEYFRWWVTVLERYGVGQESWLCSGDRILEMLPDNQDSYFSSYVPTRFNSHRFSPYRWNQPWVVERGDYHGRGAHVLMPDGSITSSQAPWGER